MKPSQPGKIYLSPVVVYQCVMPCQQDVGASNLMELTNGTQVGYVAVR